MKNIVIILLLLMGNQLIAQSLTLDPNTSFFSPKGTLLLYGQSTVTDPYNNNQHYERIGRWREMNDTIVWGLKDLQPGTLTLELFAGIAVAENNSVVTLFLDNQPQDLNVNSTTTLQDFQSQGSVSFNVTQAGTHEIKLKIKSQNTTTDFGEVEKLMVSGSAINGASVWIRRWRAAATHGDFFSDNHVNTEISVMEVDILSHEFDSYQVMDTEFGYIGSPNRAGSLGLTGMNFSLWSYGANDPVPPHYQLSHLIAVGGPNNGFGQYGHEGTGVKPRGFDPFASTPTYKFTIALRKEPGPIYNTYWCYILDPITSHWILYGCGKVFNDNGNLNYLSPTGGFLEIVGPPSNSRNGHRERSIAYRGWRMQTDSSWNVIDQLDAFYNSATSLSYKEWSQNSNGDKFLFKSGGFRDSGPNPGILTLNNPSPLPAFLQGSYLEELYRMPSDFETLPPGFVTDTEAMLKFNISNLGTNPEINLYYGTDYGLTEGIFADYLLDSVWQQSMTVPLSSINNNILSVLLTGLNPSTEYFYRLRIKNDEGITWSFDADTFMTELPLSFEEQSKEALTVYPNPTNGKFTVTFDDIRNSDLKLYNISGQLILSQKGMGKDLNIQHLESGVYYLQLLSSGKSRVVRVVKE